MSAVTSTKNFNLRQELCPEPLGTHYPTHYL